MIASLTGIADSPGALLLVGESTFSIHSMKRSANFLGITLLLIAAGAFVVEMKSPATGKAINPAPQEPTKNIRQHTAQAHHCKDSEEEKLPKKETISCERGEELRSAKATTPKQNKQFQEVPAPAPGQANESLNANHATMPLAFQVSEEWVAENFPEVPSPTLSSIKDAFENELAPEQQDTSSPEYASRWRSAEFMASARMRARYGWAAYARMQMHPIMGNYK